jgi:NAD(P)-dependent dehydrogenase (short-subunit alcohol dehydrogenase family)
MTTSSRKTVLITGCSSGIGKATARYFAEQGWNVAATMRNPDKEQELRGIPNVALFALDVTDTNSVKTAVQAAIEHFGGIDAVVNNAAFATGLPFEAELPEIIQKQFNTNLFGTMNVIREVLPHFRAKKSGAIVNISSIGGKVTFPLFSVYHGTKWALEGFSESLWFELGRLNIKVKIVEPGGTKSELSSTALSIPKNEQALEPYKAFFEPFIERMKSSTAQGAEPIDVAKVIFTAATDNSSKLRYAASGEVKVFFALRKILPLGWFMGLMRRGV